MFNDRHLNRAVILQCVRWYLASNLSLKQPECRHGAGKQTLLKGRISLIDPGCSLIPGLGSSSLCLSLPGPWFSPR